MARSWVKAVSLVCSEVSWSTNLAKSALAKVQCPSDQAHPYWACQKTGFLHQFYVVQFARFLVVVDVHDLDI